MIVNYNPLNKEIKKGLYLVPTPIGNLGDITLRSIWLLKNSNYILCEDTRISKKLFDKYEIKSKLISNHKFNEKKNLPKVINLLKSGTIISVVSDAGTPGISDPGSVLVRECIQNDIEITVLPGPSAVSSAVAVSGFSEKFFFYGFFPEKKKQTDEDLGFLSKIDSSIVFFISPKKFNKIINILKDFFSGRKILICREISKFYEEFIREDIDNLENTNIDLKGELTIVISERKRQKNNSQKLNESDKRIIDKMINRLSIKEIIDLINEKNKISKKEIYNYCLRIKNEK
tara:strand:+ start:3589 stop:4452 length:864 start_codon:yes stop_codon:yes gene_type:complete